MDEKILDNFKSSLTEKLGDENIAMIADDLAMLDAGAKNSRQELANRSAEIADLKSRNEKLVTSQGNLLQQITMTKEEPEEVEEVEVKEFNMRNYLNNDGSFKR